MSNVQWQDRSKITLNNEARSQQITLNNAYDVNFFIYSMNSKERRLKSHSNFFQILYK